MDQLPVVEEVDGPVAGVDVLHSLRIEVIEGDHSEALGGTIKDKVEMRLDRDHDWRETRLDLVVDDVELGKEALVRAEIVDRVPERETQPEGAERVRWTQEQIEAWRTGQPGQLDRMWLRRVRMQTRDGTRHGDDGV